jgi:aryl-alcohol dehydrogenase-like predicted oxidoreductase
MEDSQRLWGTKRFDLMQIHNLLDWEAHLETLMDWKAQGRVRYIGITTSHGRRHGALEKVMAEQPIDFVQFTYNILDRKAENRLLPLAAERGLAVIINRATRCPTGRASSTARTGPSSSSSSSSRTRRSPARSPRPRGSTIWSRTWAPPTAVCPLPSCARA